MRKTIFCLILILPLILVLASCSDPEPTPFPVTATPPIQAEPTGIPATQPPLVAVPTQIPPTALPPTITPFPTETPLPTSLLESKTHIPDPLLTNKTWQWVQRDANGSQMNDIAVSNPENYTLFFNDDGTFQAQLDCNNSNGRYATDNPGSIYMELGSSTLAFCNETSLDSQMAMMFGPAQSYRFEENGSVLVLAWVADGPIDYFINAQAAPTNPELLGKTWQWNGLTSSVLDVTIANPEKYTLLFNEDGSANLQADCNVVEASYTTRGSSMDIELSPSTLAACPDGSLNELYLLGLSTTTGFVLQEGILALQVGENDGSMLFTLAGETAVNAGGTANPTTSPVVPDTGEAIGIVTAPDGVNMRTGPGTTFPSLSIVPNGATLSLLGISEDGEWWLIENPDRPGEQAWVSTNFIQARNAEDVPVIEEPPALTDYPWQWLSLTTPTETTTVSDPSLYTIQFKADGTAVIKLDCNNASASYTTDKNAIDINLGATTLVACPGDSLDALYFDTLTRVTTYFFEADDLYLELPANGGTMKFAAIQSP